MTDTATTATATTATDLQWYRRATTVGERRIVTRIIAAAFQRGYTISVFDGEEWTLRRSTKRTAIEAALASTGEDSLRLRDKDGADVGTIYLVWGNDPEGDELIADYTDNETMRNFINQTGL